MLPRHFGELDGTDILANEDRALGIVHDARLSRMQVHEDAPAEVANIRCPLAQVGVLHGIEDAGVLLDGLTQGAGCPVTGADKLLGAINNGVASQEHDPGVEQRPLLCRQTVTHPPLQPPQILFGRADRHLEAVYLALRISGGTVGHRVQVRRRIGHHGIAEGHTRRTGPALEITYGERDTVAGAHDQLAAGLGVGDSAGKLRRQCQQQVDLVILEAPWGLLTHHQHAENLASLDDRRTEKAVVPGFAGLRHEHIALVARGIVQVERLCTLAYQAHKTSKKGQSHLAHGLLAQPVGSHQHVLAGIEIGQVDRADIGIDRCLDAVDDDVEGLV